jgi:pyruvate dehydrogenase E2 component (dihydrolipoamide acetyltransferase)
MIEFRMPALGAEMEAGTLVEWLRKPGDAVKRGDIIAVVDTDKGAIEIEAFDAGVFDHTVVDPGQKVPVGSVLAILRAEGEAAAPAAPVLPPPRVAVSPAARSAADRLGVDLPAVLFLKAVARACAEVPALNGHWKDQAFVAGPGIHLGCAIALRGGGLIAPAIHDVGTKTVSAIATELSDLVQRARTGGLRSSELSDATITVTNLGDLGVESGYAVIYPPQVAIVAIGRIVERPWIVDGQVAARTVVTASVSADHRATDGREAGRFLAVIDQALQAPETL